MGPGFANLERRRRRAGVDIEGVRPPMKRRGRVGSGTSIVVEDICRTTNDAGRAGLLRGPICWRILRRGRLLDPEIA